MYLEETTLQDELTFGDVVESFAYNVPVGCVFRWGFITIPPNGLQGHVELFETKKERDKRAANDSNSRRFKVLKPIICINVGKRNVWFRFEK